MLTDYQAKYLAHELTRRSSSDSVDKLAAALHDAQVDLNPHQVDAALFVFRSPLAKGALLADEVGLGKTIEAGLVMSQLWAERKRRLLVIVPSNLRKQWLQELTEKFFLPCRIVETKSYNDAVRSGQFRPLVVPEIVICSYEFAKRKATDIAATDWDLVVLDEAHRLRNVYKPQNVTANTLKVALAGKAKLLLTATPLQNSLLELFGLVSFIDEQVFGDLKSFRDQFANLSQQQVFDTLKARLGPICHRTLRRQVLPYVKYTQRLPLVEEFTPADSEDELYRLVSEYLQRDNLQALPASQRTLMTLVLRKLLASSTFAIAGALATLTERLRLMLALDDPTTTLEEDLDSDYETLDETSEEWLDDSDAVVPISGLTAPQRAAIEREIGELVAFRDLAISITRNAKGEALLKALNVAFAKAVEIGAAEKAVIFTESHKTQDYIVRLLEDSEYSDKIVLFNGSNTDDRSKAIYAVWLEANRGSDRVTGSKSADMRSALVEYFRDQGRIMIATEAGAEGINLQFCSLVVNYDLPWNPQRVEQRIGRCHRYGQKHDVVVVNFVNRKNAADFRVFQLLDEKFQLFAGVFGVSDEVLGAIGSGVDFERRIADIYQQCRHPDQIQTAFDQLQLDLSTEIDESMTRTRRQLLEHFDDDVRERLRLRDEASRACLGRIEQQLMSLTRHELKGVAAFSDDFAFELDSLPPFLSSTEAVSLGRYELPRRSGDAHLYRLGHPLAEAVLLRAAARSLPVGHVEFRYSDYEGKISVIERLVGESGWMQVTLLTVNALDEVEDQLVVVAKADGPEVTDASTAVRLLQLPARLLGDEVVDPPVDLQSRVAGEVDALQQAAAARHARFFDEEIEKLESWSDDLKLGLEREIKEFDREIRDARRAAVGGLSLEAKLEAQKVVKALEGQRNHKRRTLFDAQDQIDEQRGSLIAVLEGKLEQTVQTSELFTIRWTVV
jgi:superfamily II DNA or RNA helicase